VDGERGEATAGKKTLAKENIEVNREQKQPSVFVLHEDLC
jgi:hypothetical protein